MSLPAKIWRFFKKTLLLLLALVALLLAILLAPPLWRHWVTYPRYERLRTALQAQPRKPAVVKTLRDFKGVLHNHTFWSHDSRGTLPEILAAAKAANLNFIFFSDHPHAALDTFPRALAGTFDGVLMIPGSEANRLLVWPLRRTVLDWRQPVDAVIREVVAGGGMIFYAHTEKPHDWGNPDYQGMEIYNIHTDFKDESPLRALLEALVNKNKYRHWIYRDIFDPQAEILARWDSLNTVRRIVGIAANDAHDNQNFRARYLREGMVEWVGPNAEPLDTTRAGLKEWLLLGQPDAAGWVFRWGLDTYFHSFNFVNTHILADTLTTPSIVQNLLQGHAYIAFESLAPADGFLFFAAQSDSALAGVMGDSLRAEDIAALHVLSPLPGRLRLLRNGQVIRSAEHAYALQYLPPGRLAPGVYRADVALEFDGREVPWIYSNPIYIWH